MSAVVAGRQGLAARALGHPSFLVGAAISLVVAATALLSFVWTPHDPTVLDIGRKLQPLSAAHWLGTDQYGRDVLSMIMGGAVTSMAVSFVAVGIGLGLGVPLGLLAAGRRGPVGEAVMRANELVFASPALVMAIMLRDIFGPGALNAMVASFMGR